MMLLELLRVAEQTDIETREMQNRRLTARVVRARQREERRAEQALMDLAWSRLC
ncbi:hypothetical protein ACFWTE_10195 [Nocardiopsis sp. NPDC058631]|uniref:hypothetical protein n=1 Tax=Nocardiopsis sp. NPDC058631 TaxID=3346566 RepID=UPI003665C459